MKIATLTCLLVVGLVVIGASDTEAASHEGHDQKTPFIPHKAILTLMNEALDRTDKTKTNFAMARYPLERSNMQREGMREFVAYKMSHIVGTAGGKEEGHELKRDSFRTQILNSNDQPVAVDGTNVIAILNGTNSEKKDRPLLIVANYDTDAMTPQQNAVEDNGAGVAAMLVLAEFIAQEMKAGAYKLENTLVFAATDLSFRKYANWGGPNLPPNATTGSDRLTQVFLPEFLGDRKFRGAIVLDQILNYQEGSNSENAAEFSKTYPDAYQIMSHHKFTGNFLGLVSRPDDLDQDLKAAVQRGWDKVKQQKESESETSSSKAQIKPELIPFVHASKDQSGEAFLYFLQSDQSSFWNHHLRDDSPSYPAVLLTDTGKYRSRICNDCSRIEDSTTAENLAFAHRTISTLYNVVKELQTSAGGGSQGPIPTGMAMVTALTALVLRYLHAAPADL